MVVEAKVVADLGKIRDKISPMVHSRHTQVVEASPEAWGAKEDMSEFPDRIQVIVAVTLNVITVVKGGISPENVQRRRQIIIGIGKGNRIIMRRLADKLMTKVRTYL